MLQGIATFVAMAVLDYVWAYYTRAIADKQAKKASGHAGAIVALNALVVLSYADNPWMIAPAVAGAVVGTYLSVRRH